MLPLPPPAQASLSPAHLQPAGMTSQRPADPDISSCYVIARSYLDNCYATPPVHSNEMLVHVNDEARRTLSPAMLLTPTVGLRGGQAGVPNCRGR